MSESIIRARIDSELKSEVAAILSSMGLSLSDAIRLLLIRIKNDRKFPFELSAPNQATISALEASRQGKIEEITIDQLKQEWHEAA